MEIVEYKQATMDDINMLVDQRVIFSDELIGKQEEEKEVEFRRFSHDYFKEELNKSYLCWYAVIDGKVAAIAGLVIRRNPGNMKNPSGYWGYLMMCTLHPGSVEKASHQPLLISSSPAEEKEELPHSSCIQLKQEKQCMLKAVFTFTTNPHTGSIFSYV